MSKERLEEIQKEVNYAYRRDGSINTKAVTMHIEHYEYLYEQVERAHELEETVEDYKTVNKELHQRGRKVRKQNKRYRKVLAFYADEETYETKFATDTDETFDPFTLIELDEGEKARQVLEGSK